MNKPQTDPSCRRDPSCRNLFRTFFKVGCFTFGGGFAMIPIIQKECVDNHCWMTNDEFIDMIAVTQSAPGPVAVNSAVFAGYRLAGFGGALSALLGTVLPSFLIILAFAMFLTSQANKSVMQDFFYGVRPAVVALILGAGLGMGKKSIKGYLDLLIALTALILLIFGHIHPILLIVAGALLGVIRSHLADRKKEDGRI